MRRRSRRRPSRRRPGDARRAARRPRPSATGRLPPAEPATARVRTSRRVASGSPDHLRPVGEHHGDSARSRPADGAERGGAAARDPDRLPGGARRVGGEGRLVLTPVGALRDQVRPGRQADQAGEERDDDRQLADPQVERAFGYGRADLPMQHGRDRAQHVHGGEHDRDGPDDRPAPTLLERSGEDQELAGERRRQRNREGDDAGRHDHGRERGPAAGHPAEEAELAGRGAPLDHPGDQEQARGDQCVVDDLQHGTVEAEAVVREEAEHDQARLGERRVHDDPAEVGCAEREQRPVDQRDRREDEDRYAEVVHRAREVRDRDSEHPVQAGLSDDPREDAGHLGGRLAVRDREPAVQRENRRLDREGDEEAEEQPGGRASRQLGQVEGALLHADHDDRREHQQRAHDRVDDEGERRAHPVGAAPHADQHVQRDQHRFEERIEEQEILGGEDADHRAGQEEHQREVRPSSVAARPPAVDHACRHHHGRHPDEPDRIRVLADVVADVQVGDPCVLLRELEGGRPEVEACRRRDPEADLDQRHESCDGAEPVRRQRQDRDDERACHRQHDEDGRQPVVHQRTDRKTIVRTAMPPARART